MQPKESEDDTLVICRWCGEGQGEKEPVWDRSIMHTICATCQAHLADDANREMGLPEGEEWGAK